MTGWIDRARDLPAAEAARKLGYEVRRSASSEHTKCPACGTERRHRKSRDRRGSVGFPRSKPFAWHCFTCDVGGDAIDFVSYHVGGARYRDLEAGRRDEVRQFFEPYGSVTVHIPAATRLPRSAQSPAWENADTIYPPVGEVESFWGSCVRIDESSRAADYLAFRGITDLSLLVEHDACRALPSSSLLPAWASVGGRQWSDTHHLVVVPLYDWHGQMRSVLSRSVERTPVLKTAAATGYQRRGLVMAATHARQMLATGPSRGFHLHERFKLSVWEGEIDYLRAVSLGFDAALDPLPGEYRPSAVRGCMGIFSGSFTRDIASRVPSQTHVVLATDDDEQGDAYAVKIQELLAQRVTYERFRAPKD